MLARAGQFVHDYKPHTNIHTIINDLYDSKKVKSLALSSALIVRQVQFPDVSFYQGEINWDVMSQHTRAVIIRAGQGGWPDIKLDRNFAQARQQGLAVGFYWFYDGRFSPQAQAALLLSLLEGREFEMEVFIDWERSYGGQHEGLRNVVALMELIEDAGYDVGMYTGYYWFRGNSNAITNASQYNYLKDKPLWLAWYTNDPANVLIPSPWTRIHHWQWGTPRVDWGQETLELDMNYFNGTVQDFAVLYIEAPVPPPDEGGDETMKYKVIWSKGVSRRTAPHVGTASEPTYTGLIYGFGTEVDVLEDNIPDKLDPGNIHKKWVRFADEMYGASDYPDSVGIARKRMEKVVVDPDPIPEPEPTIYKTHDIDVYSDGRISIDGGSPF